MLAPVRRGRPLPLGDEGRRRARRPARAPRRGGRARRRRGPHRRRVRGARLRARRPRRRPAPAARARPAGVGVVGGRARAGAGRRPDRADQGRLRGVDQALAALGGGVPRLLGPAGGLRLRRRRRRPLPPDLAAAPGQGHAPRSRPPSSSPAPRSPGSSRRALAGKPLEPETLAALSTSGSRAARSRTSSPATRTPTGSRSGSRLLQGRVDWDDPIVLPLGEALNVVRRRSDGELVIRSDAGHDFCRFDGNWKMHAPVFVRDTRRAPARGLSRGWRTATRSGWSCASSTARSRAGCSRSRRSRHGYPVVHDFLPDIEGFYRGWLGRELPE